MFLDEYLSKHGLSSAQFADLSGIGHKQTVWNYRHGHRFPNPHNLRVIERFTAGEVTASDFLLQNESKLSDRRLNKEPSGG